MPEQTITAEKPTAPAPIPTIGDLPRGLLALILGLFILVVLTGAQRIPKGVDMIAANIAAGLIETGTFTFGNQIQPGETATPDYSHPPGYPALLSIIGKFSPNSAQELRCYGEGRDNCSPGTTAYLMVAIQILASFLILLLSYLIARELSGSIEIASLTLILLFITSRNAEFCLILQPYVMMTTSAVISAYFILLTYKRGSFTWAALAGAFAALAALFHPPLALVPVIVGPALYYVIRKCEGNAFTLTTTYLLCTVLLLAPWIYRNYALFNDLALTNHYSTELLTDRVAFNAMTSAEWFAAWISWMPGIGDGLASLIFAPETVERFSYVNPNSILVKDAPEILAAIYKTAASGTAYWFIVFDYIVRDPVGYLASLLPIFMHGFLGSGSLIGLAGLVALYPLINRLKATRNLDKFGLIFWTFTATSLAGALLTPNYHILNEQMLFVHAYAIAYVTGGLELPAILRRASANTRT